jgi:hypothetical protein
MAKLNWKRCGADWLLFYGKRRMGRVVPDQKYPGIYRIALPSGRLSDMANLSWAKSHALVAAEREIDYEREISPRNPKEKRGVFSDKSSPIRFSEVPATTLPESEAA